MYVIRFFRVNGFGHDVGEVKVFLTDFFFEGVSGIGVCLACEDEVMDGFLGWGVDVGC